MKRLSKEQILMLHSQLIEVSGGSDGVRLGYGLIKNHCMIDGNNSNKYER